MQAEAVGAAPQLFLYGCQVPRLLQDHHCLQPRPDRCPLRRMLDSTLPAYRRKGQAHRRYVKPRNISAQAGPLKMERTPQFDLRLML